MFIIKLVKCSRIRQHPFDGGFVGLVGIGAVAETAFELSGFLCKNMAAICLIAFYLAAFGKVKAFFGAAVSFKLGHEQGSPFVLWSFYLVCSGFGAILRIGFGRRFGRKEHYHMTSLQLGWPLQRTQFGFGTFAGELSHKLLAK